MESINSKEALDLLLDNPYRVAIGNGTIPNTLLQLQASENILLSEIPTIVINDGVYTLTSTHSGTASLASTYSSTYCAVVILDSGLSDLNILTVESFIQDIEIGSTLETVHTLTVI